MIRTTKLPSFKNQFAPNGNTSFVRQSRLGVKANIPAKSGVGGGIIAVAPGKLGIAAISPPLDEAGNSVRAQRAIRDIVGRLNADPYAAGWVTSR